MEVLVILVVSAVVISAIKNFVSSICSSNQISNKTPNTTEKSVALSRTITTTNEPVITKHQPSSGWVYEWVDDTTKHRSPSVPKHQTSESDGHTREVWARKVYQVKYGESPAYKYYGNLVYLRNQVEKVTFLPSSNRGVCKRGEGGHTARVWARKGYKVKPGEHYAYMYYGQKIYLPSQVW